MLINECNQLIQQKHMQMWNTCVGEKEDFNYNIIIKQ